MTERPQTISKTLSLNDTGETGAHQAGILIPKNALILSFFPSLDNSTKNPRHVLTFQDEASDSWQFAFIYYNNRFFGGTRNEYRLTRMTPYLKSWKLRAGDVITLERDNDRRFLIKASRTNTVPVAQGRLKLGTDWKIVNI